MSMSRLNIDGEGGLLDWLRDTSDTVFDWWCAHVGWYDEFDEPVVIRGNEYGVLFTDDIENDYTELRRYFSSVEKYGDTMMVIPWDQRWPV